MDNLFDLRKDIKYRLAFQKKPQQETVTDHLAQYRDSIVPLLINHR